DARRGRPRLRRAHRASGGGRSVRRDHMAAVRAHDDAHIRLRCPARSDRRLAPGFMSVTTIVLAIALGITAGVLAGMFGVGGGILFVPTLVVLGLDQLEAQGTSLLAILPTVLVGAWNQ